MTSIVEIAREGLTLAGSATPGPLHVEVHRDKMFAAAYTDERGIPWHIYQGWTDKRADAEFHAFSGTHLAALASAVIEQAETVERFREALLRIQFAATLMHATPNAELRARVCFMAQEALIGGGSAAFDSIAEGKVA